MCILIMNVTSIYNIILKINIVLSQKFYKNYLHVLQDS